MKKVLVLTAALFLTASVTRASILECWLTFVTTGNTYYQAPTGGGGEVDAYGYADDAFTVPLPDGVTAPTAATVGHVYTIQLWCKIIADPSIPGELMTKAGLQSASYTIVTNNSTAVTVPNMAGNDDPFGSDTSTPGTADCLSVNGSLSLSIPASRQSRLSADPDGDLGSLEESFGSTGSVKTIGLNTATLLAEQNWVLNAWPTNSANLHLIIGPTAAHFISGTSNNTVFSQILTGTLDSQGNFVAGDLYIGTPEPATLALLGFGAVATLLRRRNKK